MRKLYKKLMILGLAVTMCVSLTACGGKKEASSSNSNKKEFVYVPEYEELSETGDISSLMINGNNIFYNVWSYDEATGESTTALKKMEIGNSQAEELPISLGETESVSNMLVDKEGNIILLVTSSIMGESPEDYTQTYILKKFSADGSEIYSNDLTQMLGDTESSYVQYVTADNDGNMYLSNGDSKIWVLDKDGNQIFTIDVDDYIAAMGQTKEGKVVMATYAAEGVVLREIDFASKALGASYANAPSPDGNYSIIPGIEAGCLFSAGNILYEYDFTTQTAKEVLNWIDSDINSSDIAGFTVLEDGRILALTRQYGEQETKSEMVYLTKKKASEVTEKTVLTYGSIYMNSNTRTAIIDFNKNSDKYRIQPKEYGAEDYVAGLAQLNSDIVSGNSPDIIDLSMGATSKYIEKGVLEDLNPYIEKDSEIKREDYVENALKAYERDGKLYAIMPSFSINTLIGKTSDVGPDMGWTMDEMAEVLKTKPEGTEIFSYATKESVLSALSMYGMSQFVDWSTGKCSFDSEDFIKLLEFSNSFKNESEYTFDENEPSMYAKIRNGQTLLTMTSVSDVQSYQMYKEMYGEPVTFIGYPTREGSGSAITAGEVLFGISSKSKNKDAAWEFVRTFMTEKYQTKGDMWSLPILTKALDNMFAEAMEPQYMDDGSGNQIKTAKSSYGFDDMEIEIYEATQEDIDAIKGLISSADSTYEYNEEMYTIILEEAAAYFAGQKTAQDVAGVIQSRLQIYVNENR